MSVTMGLPAPAAPAPVVRPAAVLLPLARQEARRMVLHPLFVLGFLGTLSVVIFAVFQDSVRRDALGAVNSAPTFYAGVLGFFAAHLVATRDRRAGSRELLTPVPTRMHERTRALCLACLAPAVLTAGLVLAAHAMFLAFDLYGTRPGPGMILQSPVTVLGGCLLGVMVATWVPARSAAVLAMLLVIVFNVWTEGDNDARRPFGFMTSWLEWTSPSPDGSTALIDGSPEWHVVYLLALCGLAAAGALLPTATRRLPVLAAGAGLALVVVAAGYLQVHP
jgi:hypothetical protein